MPVGPAPTTRTSKLSRFSEAVIVLSIEPTTDETPRSLLRPFCGEDASLVVDSLKGHLRVRIIAHLKSRPNLRRLGGFVEERDRYPLSIRYNVPGGTTI